MLLALLACASSPDTGPCAPGVEPPTLEIGLGVGAFTPLPSGSEFPLVHGPQGGYHLELGLRATGLDASELLEGRATGTLLGEPFALAAPLFDLRCEDGEALESWGTQLVYDATPEELDGQPTTVEVEVTDASGVTVKASSEFVIVDPMR